MVQRAPLSKQQIIKAAIAIVVLIASIIMIMRSLGGSAAGGDSNTVYYYDLQTGELFTAEAQVPPIISPGGGQAARAYVYSCGDCSDPAQRFNAYIETFTEAAKTAMQNPTRENDADLQAGHMIAAPSTDPQWIPRMSDAAMVFEDAIGARCETPILCTGQ